MQSLLLLLKRVSDPTLCPTRRKVSSSAWSLTMMTRLLGVAMFFLLGSTAVYAQCSGSGGSYSCSSGSSISDVQNAVNSASGGATITLAAGTYNWSSEVQLSASKGVTIICASAPATTGGSTSSPCLVNASHLIFGLPSVNGTISGLYRISGFTFHQSAPNTQVVWFNSDCSAYPSACTGTMTQVRVDHNTFDQNAGNGGFVCIYIGDENSYVQVWGVIDHNLVTSSPSLWGGNAGNGGILQYIGGVNPNPLAAQLGTANNLFVEDNIGNFAPSGNTNAGYGFIDSWGGAGIVFRHNAVTDALSAAHAVTHGGGPNNLEYYNNSSTMDSGSVSQGVQDCYRCFHHQGANTFMAFNNTFRPYNGHSSTPIAMASYRDYAFGGGGAVGSAGASVDGSFPACDGSQSMDGNRSPQSTWYGYPCWHQPGRDAQGQYKPMYIWNNQWTDGTAFPSMSIDNFGGTPPPNCKTQPAGTCSYINIHMVKDREYYNAVSASAQSSPSSPFNGTTGMGFGTLANRPSSCTTSSESQYGNGAAGVGYFATDQGSQGVLYTCSATNTWSVYYTPYTYPHPLVSGSSSASGPTPPTTTKPVAPKNLNAVVQ